MFIDLFIDLHDRRIVLVINPHKCFADFMLYSSPQSSKTNYFIIFKIGL